MLEELIRSIELWLKINKKQEIVINPNLDPVLLVPGIAGTMLHAVDKNDKEERVWVRIFGADQVFQDKLWSIFNPSTGKVSVSVFLSSFHYLFVSFFGNGKQFSEEKKGNPLDYKDNNNYNMHR